MNEKDDDIRHPGTVSNPKKNLVFGRIEQFAIDRVVVIKMSITREEEKA